MDAAPADDSIRLLRMQRDLAIALASATEVKEVGRLVLSACLEVPGIDGGGLYVVDTRSGALDLVAHAGLDEDFVRQVAHYDAGSPQALTVMSGDIFEMPFQEIPSTPDLVRLGAGLAAALVLPIRNEGKVIADLNLVSKRQMRLSDESRSALLTLAAYSASAIDRVRAQMALADNRRNLESLFSTLDDLLFVVDLEGRIVHVNPAVERRMGAPAAELVGLSTLDLYAPQHREEAARVLGEMWTANRETCTIPLQARDGSFVPMELRVSHGRWDDQEALFGISRDVSERARAESAARETEERFRVIAEMSSDFIYRGRTLADGNVHLDWVVGAFGSITGYTVAELNALPGTWQTLIHVEDQDGVRRRHRPGGSSVAESIEFRITTRDGQTRWLHDSFRIEPDGEGPGVRLLGAVSDITEARRLEEHLRHAQKLEGIGQLAGGVAHDFNNLLQPILGYSELLALSMPGDHPYRQSVDAIREAAKRAKSMVARLLAFSRKHVLETRPLNLDDMVRGFVPMLHQTMRKDTAVRLDLRSSPTRVRGDAAHLEQVLLNLAINARDAMPDGGVMTVSTSLVRPDAEWLRSRPGCRAGPYVVLAVRDTGVGMTESTLEHLFEPFFTTKERGKGTGLGLATAYGILQQHGGAIEVSTHPGRGSEFQVFLPVLEGSPALDNALAEPLAAQRGTETVAVVEDDELVREFACRVLGMHGYKAMPFESPAACLAALSGSEEPIDLLLTDILLPGMDGRELGRRMVALRPGLPVLYMTGFAEETQGMADSRHTEVPSLTKPFTPSELLDRVRAAFDA